ncbi:MAG: 1-deoxy-D-xylulose-5-phosphate synthase [Verrucomicrobiae bacterium]|nr:1-deoxy-D-xylulose-5-phosphate synthase [Verrucomicrobiae bacterium]
MPTPFLDSIKNPDDLKKLKIPDLEKLAVEIREELVDIVSQNGGHLASNLGVVELTIALHKVFDCPRDRFTWDVSHQCYVHKLLTGRREQMKRVRQFGGASGFLSPVESPYDHYSAGHAGTAFSAALGMAAARDLKKSNEHVIAVIGDGTLTCGTTMEALNNTVHSTKRLIVILNDNKWAIAKNVGAIANYLNNMVTSPTFKRWHKKTEDLLERLKLGEVIKLERKAGEAAKGYLVQAAGHETGAPAVLFEEMGLSYYGPVDGHNLHDLIHMLEFAKNAEYPVVLHVLTEKGRGFQPAMDKPEPFHGCGQFDPDTGEFIKNTTIPGWNAVFGEAMIKLARDNQRMCCITGAMPSGTGLTKFAKTFPDRFFDVGIAEEHAVLFAAGLANNGLRPVCAIYSTFMQRAYDMIVHDVALQNLPVMFCMDRAGAVEDGPTHHGIYDISFLRSIPGLIQMQPSNEDEFNDMLLTMLQYAGPSAIRYPRGPAKGIPIKPVSKAIPIGKAVIVRKCSVSSGKKVTLWGLGNLLDMAIDTANLLEAGGIGCSVVNPRFIKPLDTETLAACARDAQAVVTFEDHSVEGGFGSIVLEALDNLGIHIPVIKMGWPDQFMEHGSTELLRKKYDLTAEAAAARVRASLPA